MSQPRTLPLFAFGNIAVGVIAIGNVAYGVVAIGFSVSIGVIAIGMNAVGAVSIGLNAVGPVSIAVINSIGTLAWAGVNAIGGFGDGLVNAGIHPLVGVVIAAIAAIAALTRFKARTPRVPGVGLAAALAEATGGSCSGEAMLVRDGGKLALVDGDTRIAVTGNDKHAGKRVHARVKIIDEFDETGDYREAPEKQRRYVLEHTTEVAPTPWFATRDDLDWAFSRAMLLSVAVASAIVGASWLATR